MTPSLLLTVEHRVQPSRCENLQAALIVGIDPEVYRLGYGTMEGFQVL